MRNQVGAHHCAPSPAQLPSRSFQWRSRAPSRDTTAMFPVPLLCWVLRRGRVQSQRTLWRLTAVCRCSSLAAHVWFCRSPSAPNCAAQSRAGGPSCARTTPSSALMGTGLLEDQAVTCWDSGYVQCLQNTESTCNSFVAKCGKGKNFPKDVLWCVIFVYFRA